MEIQINGGAAVLEEKGEDLGGILEKILEELKLQTKMLGELVMSKDERRYGQQEMKLEINRRMGEVINAARGTPFENSLRAMAAQFSGGKSDP